MKLKPISGGLILSVGVALLLIVLLFPSSCVGIEASPGDTILIDIWELHGRPRGLGHTNHTRPRCADR